MKKINKDLSVWTKSGKTTDMKDLVLSRGELGYDTDKKELKFGDGHTKFNQLPGIGGNNDMTKYYLGESITADLYFTEYESVYEFYFNANQEWGDCNLYGIMINNRIITLSELVLGVYHADKNASFPVFSLLDFNAWTWGNNAVGVYIKFYGDYSTTLVVTPIWQKIEFSKPEQPENPDSEYGYGY